jgi:hypothetical protein
MVTVGALALLLGSCLLIASATSLVLKAGANCSRRLVERTTITPIGTWRPGKGRVAALGTTAIGPGGPVVGPVSGIECAWFAVQLVRTPSRSQAETVPPHDVLVNVSSTMPPALADSSGSVLIDPVLLTEAPNLDDPIVTDVTVRLVYSSLPNPAPSVIPRKLIDDTRSGESLGVVETRLDPGRQAYALGSAGKYKGSVMLKPPRRGNFSVLTADERSTVLARRRANAQKARSLAITLGRAGLVVTAAATVLLILVV